MLAMAWDLEIRHHRQDRKPTWAVTRRSELSNTIARHQMGIYVEQVGLSLQPGSRPPTGAFRSSHNRVAGPPIAPAVSMARDSFHRKPARCRPVTPGPGSVRSVVPRWYLCSPGRTSVLRKPSMGSATESTRDSRPIRAARCCRHRCDDRRSEPLWSQGMGTNKESGWPQPSAVRTPDVLRTRSALPRASGPVRVRVRVRGEGCGPGTYAM
jgi:hypothetical protein